MGGGSWRRSCLREVNTKENMSGTCNEWATNTASHL